MTGSQLSSRLSTSLHLDVVGRAAFQLCVGLAPTLAGLSRQTADSLPASHEHDRIYRHLLAIFARTAAIDDEKRRCALECDQ
jgi:hypothetical protein